MIFTLWLEFEEWEPRPNDDLYNDYCNALIRIEGEKTYALNIWTTQYLEGHIKKMRNECRERYLICPDLIIEKLDRKLIEHCVTQMIEEDELKEEWLIK